MALATLLQALFGILDLAFANWNTIKIQDNKR